jgi:hypothetical protein
MPKKLIGLLIIFTFSVSALTYILLFLGQGEAESRSRRIKAELLTKIKSTSNANPEYSLSINPNLMTIIASDSAELNIQLDAETTTPQQGDSLLIQLEIAYDPSVFFKADILPGNYLAEPEVILHKVDSKNGRISYAIRGIRSLQNHSSDSVARVKFNLFNNWAEGTTSISLLPKTSIRNNDGVNYLKATSGAKILIKPQSISPLSTDSQSF